MKDIINIKTAELAVGHNDSIIKTGSVGSCVVISLYDSEAKIGGLAHAMLPTSRKKQSSEEGSEENNVLAKYADKAIDNLIVKIKKLGGKKENLVAKLVGGARMFRRLSGDKYGIGYRNLESARERLEYWGIEINSEDTGGSTGKVVQLDLRNGIVHVDTTL
jgi:chemotaxis protein CheD